MEWLKRNLVVLLGGIAALALVSGAGFFLYTRMGAESEIDAFVTEKTGQLVELMKPEAFPSAERITAIQEESKKVQAFGREVRGYLPILNLPRINSNSEFKMLLFDALSDLEARARSANVSIPTNFGFSFSAPRATMLLDQASWMPLSQQVMDVRAICDELFRAKIPELEAIRRPPADEKDKEMISNPAHAQDYLGNLSVTTNEAAGVVLTPYEIIFKGSSAELAAVLDRFSHSTNGFLVKCVAVASADIESADGDATADVAANAGPAVAGVRSGRDIMASRYRLGPQGGRGRGGGGQYTRRPAPPPPLAAAPAIAPGLLGAAAPPRSGPQVVLDEKPIRITLLVQAVRLQAAK